MAENKTPTNAVLFLGVMYRDEALLVEVVEEFKREFGNVFERCDPLNFSDLTDYYDDEMGEGINKVYLIFEEPIARERLAEIKVLTNRIEQKYADDGDRIINLDPGYITGDKFVLASAKDYTHRIYLDHGIYAEVTLTFKRDKIRFFSWTYKDYLEPEVQDLLFAGRNYFIKVNS